MAWRERLAALLAAGGLAFTGCDSWAACNGFYDPCSTQCGFSGPDSQECYNYRHPDAIIDAPIHDAAVDAKPPDAAPPDAGTD